MLQGSRWTLQATLMDGRLDFVDWSIKPDQMQTIIPLFGLIFLVLFNVVLYPLLAKVGIRRPLQKLTLSGVLAVAAFVFAALVQFEISVRQCLRAASFNNSLIIFSHSGISIFEMIINPSVYCINAKGNHHRDTFRRSRCQRLQRVRLRRKDTFAGVAR